MGKLKTILMSLTLFLAIQCLGQAPITDGLTARWTGGGNARDSAGSFDGHFSGGLSYAAGPRGRAFHLNGSDAKVDFGTGIGNFGVRDFTLAYWMKTGSHARQQGFLGRRATCDAASTFWEIHIGYVDEPGHLEFAFVSGGFKPPYFLHSTRPVNDDQWHHMAWVRQSTSAGTTIFLLYIDGVLNISNTFPELVDLTNQSALILGQSVCQGFDATTPYDGSVAEMQIFDRALSDREVSIIYQAQKPEK
jgi:hypothetical protein